jgi:hypothetical protein
MSIKEEAIMKNEWFENIKADMLERLEEREGETAWVCDIGFMLTECENATGSWYCSTYKAREEVFSNYEEFGAVAEYMAKELEITTNPLLEPELFHVQAMITLYDRLFLVGANDTDGETEITPEFIDQIRNNLETIDFDDVF